MIDVIVQLEETFPSNLYETYKFLYLSLCFEGKGHGEIALVMGRVETPCALPSKRQGLSPIVMFTQSTTTICQHEVVHGSFSTLKICFPSADGT